MSIPSVLLRMAIMQDDNSLRIRVTSQRWVIPSGVVCETAADIWANGWQQERWWVTVIEMMLHG